VILVITQNGLKNEEDMRLQLERFRELFFSRFLKQTITHCFPVVSVFCSNTSDAQKTFITLQFAHSVTQKLLNLVKGMSKILESV
jgi:NRPS condensation-like uncharacterized protein